MNQSPIEGLLGGLLAFVIGGACWFSVWQRKRQSTKQIAKMAARRGWSFSARDSSVLAGLPVGHLGVSFQKIRNIAYDETANVWVFEQSLHGGRSRLEVTGALTTLPGDCPWLTICRRNAPSPLHEAADFVMESIEFNDFFAVSGDELLAFAFLDGEMMELLVAERAFITAISINRNYLVVYTSWLEPYRWPRLAEFAVRVRESAPNAVAAYYEAT